MKKIIITISREFGSGGREIGERVARQLGIDFYDKKIIDMAAEESGFSPDYVEQIEQKMTNSLMYNIAAAGAYPLSVMPVESSNSDKLFIVESRIINELADKGSCVIIGRCADYVLRERSDCLHVFIHANKEFKISRAIKEYNIDAGAAAGEVAKIDKKRKNYYQRYTDRKWGEAANFHATLDSSAIGINACVKCILDMTEGFFLK